MTGFIMMELQAMEYLALRFRIWCRHISSLLCGSHICQCCIVCFLSSTRCRAWCGFTYTVKAPLSGNGVVINEVLASNTTNATVEAGEHEDWVSCTTTIPRKWTSVDILFRMNYQPDQMASPFRHCHSGLRLCAYLGRQWSADGPTSCQLEIIGWWWIRLPIDGTQTFIDSVNFGQQVADKGYARFPNGTGGLWSRKLL
jgi:hypothetical protein